MIAYVAHDTQLVSRLLHAHDFHLLSLHTYEEINDCMGITGMSYWRVLWLGLQCQAVLDNNLLTQHEDIY